MNSTRIEPNDSTTGIFTSISSPTQAPTAWFEDHSFCTQPREFQLVLWLLELILFIPFGLLFYFSYKKLGLAVRRDKLVQYSVFNSAFTFAGVTSMIVIHFYVENTYQDCTFPYADADILETASPVEDVTVFSYFWLIGIIVSLYYFIRIYLYNLSKTIEKNVHGAHENCCKKYSRKIITTGVSFGLAALYKPFKIRGTYSDPDTGIYQKHCACSNEYIMIISLLSFLIIVCCVLLKCCCGARSDEEDNAAKNRSKNNDDDSTCIKLLFGCVLVISIAWYTFSILLIRFLSILYDIIQLLTTDMSPTDVLLSIFKLEYFVFFVAIINMCVLSCCGGKMLNLDVNHETELAVTVSTGIQHKQPTTNAVNVNSHPYASAPRPARVQSQESV